jgi:HD superfamily phosphohydrolase
VKHLPVLRFFSREQISVFETKTMQFIEQFINRRRSDIIIELLYSVNTWDNYSLSVIYLHLLGTFQYVFNESTVINNMIGMLFKNIGPRRQSLISTTREKDVILGDLTELELDADRMDDLRTQLSY